MAGTGRQGRRHRGAPAGLLWFGRRPALLAVLSLAAVSVQGVGALNGALRRDMVRMRAATLQRRLAQSAANGNQPAVVECLGAGADPDGVGFGCSPLGYALANGRLEVVKYLLARGADPMRRGANGQFPVVIAASTRGIPEERRPEVIALLARAARERGAPLGGVDDALRSSLEAARPPATLAALLSAGADPDVRMADGRTALRYVLGQRRTNVAGLLIAAGARPPGRGL